METVYWYLEGFVDHSRTTWRTAIRSLPFRVGRRAGSELVLASAHVSSAHLEFFEREGQLWVEDLESTNGTWINERQLDHPSRLEHGDVLRLAEFELRLVEVAPHSLANVTTETVSRISSTDLTRQRTRLSNFDAMLRNDSLRVRFQPVVRLADNEVIGYEALGGGFLGGKEAEPDDLFALAAVRSAEIELSRALRRRSLIAANQLAPNLALFLNVHPAEIDDPAALIENVKESAKTYPGDLVLEIHEATVSNPIALRSLREQLSGIGASIAFDDFGTGQSRLFELAEVNPRFVKFDALWTQDLHCASRRRRELVRTLVRAAMRLGISTIAEGVEDPRDVEACCELGFEHAQGFHLGRPEPAGSFDRTSLPPGER